MKQGFLDTGAGKAWLAFGCLLALGVVYLTVREMPAIRREMRLMRM